MLSLSIALKFFFIFHKHISTFCFKDYPFLSICREFNVNDTDPYAPAYGIAPPLPMDEVIHIHRESIGTSDSVAAMEAAYEKSLGIVPKKDSGEP